MQLERSREDYMSIFDKKEHSRSPGSDVQGVAPSMAGGHPYGIADVIRLMRGLPVDQQPELVVRVIKTTLESVNVRVASLIEDASRQQQKLSEQVGSLQAKILDLTKQIEGHRQEVARLERELAETTTARERLESAEKSATVGPASVPTPPPLVHGRVDPLPFPPRRSGPPKPPDSNQT
jgi:hypothetical protein